LGSVQKTLLYERGFRDHAVFSYRSFIQKTTARSDPMRSRLAADPYTTLSR